MRNKLSELNYCIPSNLQGFFGKGFLSRSKPTYEVISNISQKAFSKSEKLRRCKSIESCSIKQSLISSKKVITGFFTP